MSSLRTILALSIALAAFAAGAAGAQTLGVPVVEPAVAAPSATAVELAPKVTLDVSALRRASGKGVLQLEFTVTNRSDIDATLYNLGLADNDGLVGIKLVDFGNKRRYSMGTADGACLCSAFANQGLVRPGEAKTFWAWFALPPADVQTMSVLFPGYSPILDVQLQ